jgi:hypothetical protein
MLRIAMTEANPFRLTRCVRIGFKTADAIAMRRGVESHCGSATAELIPLAKAAERARATT